VNSVIQAAQDTGDALEFGKVLPFRSARTPARKLRRLLNGDIDSIDLTAGSRISNIRPEYLAIAEGPAFVESFGVVIGKLQTLSSYQGYRAVIHDHVTGRSVRLTLDESVKEQAHNLWDEVVAAQGLLRRNRQTGLPQSMRRVTRLTKREPVAPGAYRSAAGAAPRPEDAPSPEEAVRRIRDA
jgi:hypothetical protein